MDCHANSRPDTVLTSATAALPANLSFDHASREALGDCISCHAEPQFSSWSGGRFHPSGSAAPATCLPCHAGERPITAAGWTPSTSTPAAIPFDYVGNAQGRTTHGYAQDCVACHTGPGTGSFGGTQNWIGGKFRHDPSGVAGTTCVACHASQRPTVPVTGTGFPAPFDHSTNGTGDCFGCHQATVAAGSYVNWVNPVTRTWPGSDWQGGRSYPGATLIGSGDRFVTATEIALTRSGSNNLVTGSSSSMATLYNQVLHTSTAIPAEVSPGTTPSGDPNKCWHCHAHDANARVTAFSNGLFHASLANYSAIVGGPVTPLPQPTTHCTDCHAQMRPVGIVEKAASDLQPMDHNALFTASATIKGQTVNGVAAMECASCHQNPGNTWTDGAFHVNIIGTGATPQDCTVCHYPLMADAPKSNLTIGTSYSMRHGSNQLTLQNCQVCHAGAFFRGAVTPIVSTLWQGGAFHSSIPSQPGACIDCHAVTRPGDGAPTQSSFTYAFAAGGTPTNGGQWMHHGAGPAVGKDCVVCHAADARPAVSGWARSSSFHAKVTAANACQACHGLTNGGGPVPGTNNNLPGGITSSSTVSSAASNPATGIPTGTLDQISHVDINVSSRDCNACHTQAGVSTAPGVAGKEWAQASFHASFGAGTPLVMNGTTGRCSDCHLNVKPAAGFAAQDHSSFTNAPGSQDCASCHSFPGTGTPAAANWLGASGTPQFISVGGFPIAQPPATVAKTQPGINNLPHSTVASGVSCTVCHATASGGRNANGYDHASALISTNCASCHEAGSNLLGTNWNNASSEASGAGDTRPFTLSSVRAAFSGNSRDVTYPNHFYPVDCHECHAVPSGISHVTTGAAYVSIGASPPSGAWRFPHNTSNMGNPPTCLVCHPNGPP